MILLDTHVLLWSVDGRRRIGPRAQRVISRAPVRYASSISHAELAIKAARQGIHLPADFVPRLSDAGFTALPFEQRHAAGLGAFPTLHDHDPFDRMLVAQAHVDGLTLVTADSRLLELDASWIQDATE